MDLPEKKVQEYIFEKDKREYDRPTAESDSSR